MSKLIYIIQKTKASDAAERKAARDAMFYTYTAPSGVVEKRKKVQGKEVNYVVLAVLDSRHTDYKRNKGFRFYRGAEDMKTAIKIKSKAEDKAKKELDQIKKDKSGKDLELALGYFYYFNSFEYVIVEIDRG